MKTKTKKDHAREQAKAQLESICEMVKELLSSNEETVEEARQTIQEDALSVRVRADWYNAGCNDGRAEPVEFEILLCTGGPAVRIVGDLDRHCQPDRTRLQYQDWGTPWTEYFPEDDTERAALQTYCEQFYYGE